MFWLRNKDNIFQLRSLILSPVPFLTASLLDSLFKLGLNEIYVWFLLPTYPNFSNPTLNIKMVFGEKIPKMGTFSDFVTIFFVKCYNKI